MIGGTAATTAGEAQCGLLRLQFDRAVTSAIQGAPIGSDGGRPQNRGSGEALGPTDKTRWPRRAPGGARPEGRPAPPG